MVSIIILFSCFSFTIVLIDWLISIITRTIRFHGLLYYLLQMYGWFLCGSKYSKIFCMEILLIFLGGALNFATGWRIDFIM